MIAVNGASITPGETSIDVSARIARTTGPLSIATVDNAGHVKRYVLPRTETLSSEDAASGLPSAVTATINVVRPLSSALILVCISLLLARKRSRDPEAMLLSFGFLLLAYGEANDVWLWQLHLPLIPPVVDWTETLFSVLGFWAMFVGFCAFPDGRFANRWARLAWLVPTTYVVVNAAGRFALFTNPALQFALDVPIYTIVVMPVLLRYRAASPGVQRQQIKWALFGGVIMIIAALISYAINNDAIASSPRPGSHILPAPLSFRKQTSWPFLSVFLVSLLRYRLYDVDTVITRSTVYAVLAVALVAIFACSEKVIELLGEEYFGQRLGALAGGLGAAVSAVMVAPLHHRISHWVEHRFRHDLLHLRQNLPPLMATLRETASPAALAEAALDWVVNAVHAVGGAVVSEDGRILATRGLSTADSRNPSDPMGLQDPNPTLRSIERTSLCLSTSRSGPRV